MWLVRCPRCRKPRLYGVHQVRGMWTLVPGLIVLELACPCRETVLILTGRGVDDPRPPTTGPGVPRPAARP